MRHPILSGAAAGAAGGVAMALWAMAASASRGLGALLPLEAIAATLFGPEALVGGVWMPLVGVVLHLATSATWGTLYSLLLPRRTHPGLSAGLGTAFGTGVLAFMTYAILPWMDPVLRAHVDLAPVAWAVGHVLWGAVTGLLLPLLRREAPAAVDPARVPGRGAPREREA